MSEPIGPGDWVECYRAGNGEPGVGEFWQMTPLPAINALYHVEAILPADMFRDGLPALVFTNIPGRYPDGQRFAYDLARFRPIYRPKSSLIEALKAPVSLPDEVAVTRPALAERLPREPLRAEGLDHG